MSKEFSELVPMLDAFTALSYSEQNDVLLGKRSIVIPKPETKPEQVKDEKFTIRKNTIEIHSRFDEYNLPTIIHRSCIAYLNYEKAGDNGYRMWFNYHNPIHKETGFMLYCEDYLPFVAWFDDDDLASLLPYVQPTEPIDPNFGVDLHPFTGFFRKEVKSDE